jgi:L-arabinokinase
MQAVAAASGWTLERLDLASWCQIAENHVVGAPCGIMDQMTSACGKQGELLELLCQPARILGNVNVARALGVWGIDSGLRHAVSGADYGQVRVGAFMGYRMIAALAGLPTRILGRGRVTIDDPRWRGYLANLSPSEYGERFASALPDAMWGAEFLAAYGGISDSVTSVEPERLYEVRKPTQHPIHEHVRVRTFAELLRHEARSESERAQLGELMYQSHASYSACGLGSSGTDRLVDLVRERGPQHGLYGAKITGGGSGGTVAVLAREDAEATVLDVVRKYAEETGHEPVVFRGSSLGAHEFGSVRLRPA